MKGSLSLGKVAGIGVFIHWTFLILVGFIIFWQLQAGGTMQDVLYALLFLMVLFLCVILHEFGHALMARKFGIPTKDITILPIGGLARLEKMPEDPKEELAVAFAGPAVNVVIAAVLFLILIPSGGLNMEVENLEEFSRSSTGFLFNLFWVNVMLVLFNLIPAFPMDGGRVLRAILAMNMNRSKATKIAARVGQVFSVVFVIAGFFLTPVLILIGVFVFIGAQAESNFVQSQTLLRGYKVKDVLILNYFKLSTESKVKDAVDILLETQAKDFVVMEGEKVVGLLRRNAIIQALSNKGPEASVTEVMTSTFTFLNPEMPLTEIYQLMQQEKEMFLPVIQNNIILGVVDTENILEFLMVKGAIANSA